MVTGLVGGGPSKVVQSWTGVGVGAMAVVDVFDIEGGFLCETEAEIV